MSETSIVHDYIPVIKRSGFITGYFHHNFSPIKLRAKKLIKYPLMKYTIGRLKNNVLFMNPLLLLVYYSSG